MRRKQVTNDVILVVFFTAREQSLAQHGNQNKEALRPAYVIQKTPTARGREMLSDVVVIIKIQNNTSL